MEPEPMECDSTSPEIDPLLAEQCKVEGNSAYVAKNYIAAVEHYDQAIRHNPNEASYYGNRAAAKMMLNRYQSALEDAQHSITLDDTFVKGHLRTAKCHMMLGNPALSLDYYDKVLTLQPRNTQAADEKRQSLHLIQQMEKAQIEFNRNQFRTCIYHMDQCLAVSPYCSKFRTMKAEALAMQGRLDESLSLTNDLLRESSNNADAIYVKALCLYYQDATEQAHKFLQRVLRDDPDNKKALQVIKRSKQLLRKKEEGNAAFKRGAYQEAYDLYTEALSIDPYNRTTNAKLYCNRALMAQKLCKYSEGISDCTSAIELDQSYVRAYQRRATLYQQNDQHEECVRDWKKVYELDRTLENKQSLKEAEKQLKLSKRKDYYKILGIDKSASQDEVKRAYRKKAMLHHPDRHAAAEPKVREEEEVKFKEVSEAYSVLSDTRKKMRYDNGQDLEEGMDIDPSQIFVNLFGGMNGFDPFGGGGGRSSYSFNMGGGPSSFSFTF